jgi:hypothetical protein
MGASLIALVLVGSVVVGGALLVAFAVFMARRNDVR